MQGNETFASELLSEVKAQSRRWFIAFILMTMLEALTIVWFTFPILESDAENIAVASEGEGNANYFGDNEIGGSVTQWQR